MGIGTGEIAEENVRFAAVFGGTVDADNPPIGDHMRSIALVGDNGFLQRGQFVIRTQAKGAEVAMLCDDLMEGLWHHVPLCF